MVIKELKLNESGGDFIREMDALLKEDEQATKRSPKGGVPTPNAEAAGRLRPAAPNKADMLDKAREMGLELDSSLDLHEILARQWGMEYVDLDDYPVTDQKVLRMVAPDLARSYRVFPLAYDGTADTLTLAISDPANVTIVDDLSLSLGCTIHPVVAKEDAILDRINQRYGAGEESLDSILEDFASEEEDVLAEDNADVIQLTDDPNELAKQPQVKQIVSLIFLKAINDRASDIHIEPFENLLRIRYRVDGVLREMNSPPSSLAGPIASRIKVMANLDIAETRRPQSGRIKMRLPDQRECDLRLETVPTSAGESISMRVLDKAMMAIGIHDLGMGQEMLDEFMRQIRKPNGIVLVAGPTGCGKTTTLYAAINEVRSPEDKLITTEDPVEYELEGIVQVSVNEKFGLTFAACLRSILRQDPDTILVGEIRDVETAQISIQSALTGHLVFSTLHTNSAAGTITRLIDMGIEPFLITSTVQAVVGQRLIRTICPNCRGPYTPTEEELVDFGLSQEQATDITFYHGDGCEECNFTGYKGRMGIFEMLVMTEEIVDLVLNNATTDDIHNLAVKQGMITLRQDGWMKICQGITTLSEVGSHTPNEAVEVPGELPEGGAPPREQLPQQTPAVAQARKDSVAPASEAAKPVDGEDALPGLL